jgi:hypothetical protein
MVSTTLVIPAEAGIHFDFGLWRCRENRLTSVCFSSTIHGRRLLSFACPKESNQRKRHPRGRGLPASLPANSASRLRGPLTAHPCAEIGRARILRAPACGARWLFLHLLAAAERGPGRAKRGSPCRRSGPSHICDVAYMRCLLFLALGSPLSSGGGRTEQPRAPHAGARGIAPISTTGHGWPVGETRPPVANRSLRERRESEGAVFFGYFLLGKQMKVTGGHGWPTNHTWT